MLKSLLLIAVTACLLASALAASQGAPGGVPVNSPEPFTLLALAGGAAVAGGLAYRRRRKR